MQCDFLMIAICILKINEKRLFLFVSRRKMLKKIFANKSLQAGSIYLFASIINKAIAFITIPIFTRLLTVGEYGIVSTYSSYVSIIYYFMGLSSEYTVRNAYADYKNDIPQYMASVYSLSILSSLITSGIVLILNAYIFRTASIWICGCCLVQAVMTFFVNAKSHEFMMEKKFYKRAVLMAGPNLLSVLSGLAFISLTIQHRDVGRILGYVLSYITFGLYCFYTVLKRADIKKFNKYWGYIIKISPPLIIHGLSVIALSQLDRIMITSMRSSEETGVYSIIYSMSMVAAAVTSAIEAVWTPWFTEKYKECKYSEIDKKASQCLFFASILTSVILLIAPEVLKLMTPKQYWNGVSMIPPLVVSSFLIYMYSLYIGVELYEKRTKSISLATIMATLSNVVLNYIFIPRLGALAAAYTTLFSYTLLFLMHRFNGKRINSSVLKLNIFSIPLLIIVMAAVLFYLQQTNYFFRWGVAVIGTVIFIVIYIYQNAKGKNI